MTNKGKSSSVFAVLMVIAVIIATYISIKVGQGGTFRMDQAIQGLAAKVSPGLHPFFIDITEMGDKKGIGVVALIMLLWLLIRRKNFMGAAVFALSLAMGNELSKVLKDFFARPRPSLPHLVHVSSYSYPSGHAMVGMVVYFFIAYLLLESLRSRTVKVIVVMAAALLLLLIGASRIILQVHYPTDVLGGYALGFIWVGISIYIYKFLQRKYGKG
jgi:membrane-associated phospholipid phosphatase